MVVLATTLPTLVCVSLWWRMVKNRSIEWKSATCTSATALATSLILLLGSQRVALIGFKDAVAIVNTRADEIERLTDKNRRLSVLTAKAVVSSLNGVLVAEPHSDEPFVKSIEDLLKEAGASTSEIDGILGRTNSSATKR